jgi:uncharacterized protein YdeI (YjbR/CyaY-like superfamily)
VRGFIDDYELKDHNLFPMGKGILMMAVKAEIRKKIGKQQGDWVTLKLYYDEPEDNTGEDFLICLKEDSAAENTFNKATKKQQQEIIDWISASKNEDMKVERIAKMLDILAHGRFL